MGTATEHSLRRILTELESHTIPTGAATETTLAAIRTAIEKLDDLQNALDSVGTDELDVNIDNWPGTPAIYNVTMTNADTEYSQALPANTRKFLIKCRTSFAIKLSFTSGQSGTTYLTVPADQSYWEDQINDASITLYFQCANAGKVAEIVAWS